MRPLELALLAVELAGLLGPRLGGRMDRFVGYAALLPVPVAFQLWLEGWRWQRRAGARRRAAGRGSDVRLSGADRPVRDRHRDLRLADESRPETFTDDPADRRELIGQLWYPAAPGTAGTRVSYLDEAAAVRPLAGLLRLPPFVFDHLAQIGTPAVAGAPVATAPARWPVLIYLHGRGGYRQANTRQVTQLASQGYVVLTLDQPYAASGVRLPDGRHPGDLR